MTVNGAQPEAPPGHRSSGDRPVDFLLSLSSRLQGGLSEELNRALELATGFFGLTFGIVSRVEDESYIVEHVHQPEGDALAVGQRFELGQTYCAITLEASDVVSIGEMRSSRHSGHPCYGCFGLESYLGVPLQVEGEVYGTLNFSSPEPRSLPWTEMDRQLVRLLARWVESLIAQERLGNRLAGALDDLDRANAELRQRNEDLDGFTHVASHDLQAPLRKLVGFSELLAADLGPELSDPVAEDLHYIRESALGMQSLVQDLLEFSRTGNARIDPVAVELDGCVDGALETLRAVLAESRAELVRAPLPAVRGQATLLTQVFQNLIGNALKFQRPETTPRVEIAGEQDGDTVHVRVRDNGIGIAPEHVEQVFAPFQRLHSASAYEGTGLGLAICRKILSRHGGDIRVEPTPGGGSTFVVTLEAGARQGAGS